MSQASMLLWFYSCVNVVSLRKGQPSRPLSALYIRDRAEISQKVSRGYGVGGDGLNEKRCRSGVVTVRGERDSGEAVRSWLLWARKWGSWS